MGLCNSPDIFQEKINELFYGIDFIRAYIDDLLITSPSDFDDHLEKLDLIFTRLKAAGLKVNANKSFYMRWNTLVIGLPEMESNHSPKRLMQS